MNSLQEFIDYVWDFYSPNSDLYPIKGLTKQDILDALLPLMLPIHVTQ